MLTRILSLPKDHSFFLFGPRGAGKSTLIENQFDHDRCLWLDLLDDEEEERFALNPSELHAMVMSLPPEKTHVVIDEIQKIPKLLDVVHSLTNKTDKFFILTGSSARKLKHGGANLLAGRAFVYHLHAFSYFELEDEFSLDNALQWGLLPQVTTYQTDEKRIKFLQAYARTYLKEEVWEEQYVRKLNPFRKFLEVSSQCNGKIINNANISRDVGVDEKTITNYFTILEDTLIGFFLEPFEHSFRKRLSQKPKFYFFDTGVVRSLSRTLSTPLKPGTSAYGESFEHFIILECIKLASYCKYEFRFSYLQTKNDVEIDLVVERPALPLLFIEIKSSASVREEDLSSMNQIIEDFGSCEAICLSNDKYRKKFGNVTVIPWKEGIKEYFVD